MQALNLRNWSNVINGLGKNPKKKAGIDKRGIGIGIKKILTICTTLNSFESIKKILELDDIIYGTFGIHPHETDKNYVSKKIILNNIKKNRKIIGIGETGLDFYYNNSKKNKQIDSFKIHIEAAIEANLPILFTQEMLRKKLLTS